MSQANDPRDERAQACAAVIKQLIDLTCQGVLQRTGSRAAAAEVREDVAAGRTVVEFVLTVAADKASILGLEHRHDGERQLTQGLLEVNLVPPQPGQQGPGWMQ